MMINNRTAHDTKRIAANPGGEQIDLALDAGVDEWRGELEQKRGESQDLTDQCKTLLVGLVDAFRHLEDQGRQCRGCVADDETLPARYLEPYPSEGVAARQRAADSLTQWYFDHGQEPTETTLHIAAVASSPHTLAALAQLNEAKNAFARVVGDLRRSMACDRPERGELYRLTTFALGRRPKVMRDNVIGQTVRELIHPRLSLRQATRTVAIIDPMPASIRWRWVQDRASDRITRDEALRMLEKYGDNAMAQADQQRLASLKPDEPLSITKKRVNQLRVAFTYPKGNRPKGAYGYVKSRMPIFYDGYDPLGYRTEPDLTLVPENSPRFERQKRLEDTPFLSTLAVYRYRNPAEAEHLGANSESV